MHRLGPGGLDLEHGAREALRPHFLPFDLTDGAGGRGVNPSEAGPAPRQSGGGGGHAGLSKARDTRRRRGSGHRREPTGGGLWPGTAAGHLPCARRFPGAADATEGGRRPRLGGRRERLGRLRLSPGPACPAAIVAGSPPAAAPSGCHGRHGISSRVRGGETRTPFHSPELCSRGSVLRESGSKAWARSGVCELGTGCRPGASWGAWLC